MYSWVLMKKVLLSLLRFVEHLPESSTEETAKTAIRKKNTMWNSFNDIVRALQIGRNKVISVIKELVGFGFIRKLKVLKKDGSYSDNHYSVADLAVPSAAFVRAAVYPGMLANRRSRINRAFFLLLAKLLAYLSECDIIYLLSTLSQRRR